RGMAAVLLAISVLSPAFGQDVSTSFEFPDITSQFTLGTPPKSVTFQGGEAKTVGQPGLYRTGSKSWLIDADRTGTITFETPAAQVNLFFKDQDASVQSKLTVIDTNNQVIATFNGSANGPDGMGFTRVQLTNTAVKTITLKNNAGGGSSPPDPDPYPGAAHRLLELDTLAASPYAVIDDFSFTAVELTQKLFFAQFADGGGLFSQITLVNLSATGAVTGKIELFGDNGALLTVDLNGEIVVGGKIFSIPAGGAAVFSTDGAGEVQTGAVIVSSDQPLAGVILFAGLGVAGVGNSQPLQSFLAPMETDLQNGIRTGLAIMNLDVEEKTLQAELVDLGGNVVATGTASRAENPQPLAANGHIALFLDEFNWDVAPDLNNFRGVLKVTASIGQIAATVLRLNPGEFATLPVAQPQ
ncbi:hypothetical protein MYX75_12315, partial [Acidobacteria bacterium AH-259-A15]|nr:hypothetical protein [Acidobacteria bacterium AH-259-A15]